MVRPGGVSELGKEQEEFAVSTWPVTFRVPLLETLIPPLVQTLPLIFMVPLLLIVMALQEVLAA